MISDFLDRLKGMWLPALSLFLVAYFSYHALQGDRGLFSYIHLKSDLAVAEQNLAATKSQREALEQRVRLMNPHHPDKDMLDEQVRKTLGYARPDEVVIYKK